MCLSLDISVFFATYHRLMMLSTASSHSCCNLIKDLRGKKKENQTKQNSQNKTKQNKQGLHFGFKTDPNFCLNQKCE
jgi:hypothetical protein